MSIVLIQREIQMDLKIVEDEECIGIGVDNPESYIDCFILIFDEDEDEKSVFKDLKSAKLFAEIIVNLIRSIYNDTE